MNFIKKLWQWFIGLFSKKLSKIANDDRFFWRGLWWTPLVGRVSGRRKEDKHTKIRRKIANKSIKTNRLWAKRK